ncbi:D-2-hydroxyacid dehydrogenase [Haloechinothrix sp. LS1_15]|uniref:D-2-hydroxyacid dehydrogenase n=1 Tax=Haloechinothrix sp. LS1_15 TaxID=2652248 RepID=UPI002946641C|nr:D-2-hydroxyacid dehydrogenase [Haloechinothrix sp. LS1_15]MDV6011727.1 D-2-hydroxyacid dehydrogenase [Haloechinothrix sp. LS1_15]
MDRVERAAEVRYASAAELPDALRGADALFVWDFLSTAVPDAWHAADRLRWLHIASAGVDPVMFDELRAGDVVLTNSRGVFDTPIAEYVLGAILALAKDLFHTRDLQREKRWVHRETARVAGTSAVVVGTGPIGRAIARLLRAAGIRVSGAGRRYREHDSDFGVVYPSDSLSEHVGGVDYVIAVAPLTEQTSRMFDRHVFRAMRNDAWFINVGRGELAETSDLIEALDTGQLRGAVLDVFDTEPLPASSPLWTMPNVLVSPHMSGDVVGWRDALVEIFTDNFARWVDGKPLRNVVDKELGYVPSETPSG